MLSRNANNSLLLSLFFCLIHSPSCPQNICNFIFFKQFNQNNSFFQPWNGFLKLNEEIERCLKEAWRWKTKQHKNSKLFLNSTLNWFGTKVHGIFCCLWPMRTCLLFGGRGRERDNISVDCNFVPCSIHVCSLIMNSFIFRLFRQQEQQQEKGLNQKKFIIVQTINCLSRYERRTSSFQLEQFEASWWIEK